MEYNDVINFWFSQNPKLWFNGGKEFDEEIQNKFSHLYDEISLGKHDNWMESPRGALGLILVLDQFSRNIFRGRPEAFEYDFKALYFCKCALKKGYLDLLSGPEKSFLLLPLMHSESIGDQDLCVAYFSELSKTDETYQSNLRFAKEHRDIIARFGRFPHRNKILGRDSSQEEVEFLKVHSGF